MTPQKAMAATLGKLGIPAKRIEVYGSQIMITAWSEGAAREWASALSAFSKVRAVIRSREENSDISKTLKANPGLTVSRLYHEVWRVAAVI